MVLWRLGVGAHQQKAPIGEMRARGPHLLAVDDEMVAVVDRAGAQAGQIGAGARLGIALAPDLVGAEDLRQVARFLLLGAPMDQGRAQKVEAALARQDRRAGAEIFLVEDHLLHKAGAAPAIFLGPGDADPAGGVHLLLPGDALFEDRAVGRDALVLRVLDLEIVGQIGFEPSAELAAELGVLGRVGKIHGGPSLPAQDSRLRARLSSRRKAGSTDGPRITCQIRIGERGRLARVAFCTTMGPGLRRDDIVSADMLSQQQIEQYRHDGYLFPFPALTAEELAECNAGLARFESRLGNPVNRGDPRWRSASYAILPWVDALVRHPKILDVGRGSDRPRHPGLHRDLFIKEAESPTFAAWHQDATYFGLDPYEHVTAWVALSEAGAEAGCMEVVSAQGRPRQLSHAALRLEHSINGAGQAIVEPFDEGGAVMMDIARRQLLIASHAVPPSFGAEPGASPPGRASASAMSRRIAGSPAPCGWAPGWCAGMTALAIST